MVTAVQGKTQTAGMGDCDEGNCCAAANIRTFGVKRLRYFPVRAHN